MEVLSAVLGVVCFATLAAALGVASATDLSCRIIPNGCVLAVACSGFARIVAGVLVGERAAPLVAGALLGCLSVLVVMLAAAALSARGGRRSGVGGGDVKLLAAVGVWTGPLAGLVTVGVSCLLGVVFWVPYRMVRRALSARAHGSSQSPCRVLSEGIPLAPAVTMATAAAVLLGPFPLP